MNGPEDDGWTWLLGRPHGVRRTLLAQVLGTFDVEAVLAEAAAARGHGADAPEGKGTAVLALDEVPDGGVVEAMVDGEVVAVARRGEQVWVLDGLCPHAQGPLGEGALDGDTLVCPYHGWRFDLDTGACHTGGGEDVRTWRVDVVDGWVRVSAAA